MVVCHNLTKHDLPCAKPLPFCHHVVKGYISVGVSFKLILPLNSIGKLAWMNPTTLQRETWWWDGGSFVAALMAQDLDIDSIGESTMYFILYQSTLEQNTLHSCRPIEMH